MVPGTLPRCQEVLEVVDGGSAKEDGSIRAWVFIGEVVMTRWESLWNVIDMTSVNFLLMKDDSDDDDDDGGGGDDDGGGLLVFNT